MDRGQLWVGVEEVGNVAVEGVFAAGEFCGVERSEMETEQVQRTGDGLAGEVARLRDLDFLELGATAAQEREQSVLLEAGEDPCDPQ